MDNYLLKAKALLQKYRKGTCTDEEKALLEEWYLRLNTREADLSDDELEEDLRQLKARLERISRTGSGKIIRLRAVAAVFLLLAGVGLCWYLVADRPSSSLFSRSEERRVGKEGVSKCSSRWSPEHNKKNNNKRK